MTTLVLGIDSGATRTGVALVRLDPSGWLHIDQGAHLDNESDALRWMVTNTHQRLGAIAIEQIVGFAYEAKRVQALVETARFEGRMLELCRFLKAQVSAFAAGEVRGELCRCRTAGDDQVRIVVEGLTKTRPALTADVRPHVYDAAAAAILAIIRATGRPLVLPPAVNAALHASQRDAKARRAAKRAGNELVAVPRKLTRAQSKRRSDAATKAWTGRRT
jgi:Holliday junction resolvasome RuvABC endonuclease subunit